MSYFPLVLSEVRTHFRDMTPAMEDELWLEYEGIPLKWNIPIGVLFDLLCPSADADNSNGGSPNMVLPWRLVVHFQSFPLKKLLRCKTLFTVRQHYLNTWKEACYLRFASSKIAMQCLQNDHQRLWDALTHLREDVHVQTNARIVSAGIMGATGNTPQGLALVQAALENKSVEDLPIRIYVHCTRASHEEGMNSDNHMCPIQRSVKPRDKQGHDLTVADLLHQVLPTLIDPATSGTNSAAVSITLLPTARLLIQGFCPPLSTPLSWLSTYCSHPDGFLYVAVQLEEPETEEERRERMDPFASTRGEMSMSMMGASGSGMGSGFMNSMTNFHPSTLPGYHAASNAVNVVYQNLPALPSIPLPSMTSLFGGAAASPSMPLQPAAAPAHQQAPFSSASAIEPDLPPVGSSDDLLVGGEEVDSPGLEKDQQRAGFLRGGEEHDGDASHQVRPGEELP
jgi:autophagy-related protein 5